MMIIIMRITYNFQSHQIVVVVVVVVVVFVIVLFVVLSGGCGTLVYNQLLCWVF